jgi:hypothetical protein
LANETAVLTLLVVLPAPPFKNGKTNDFHGVVFGQVLRMSLMGYATETTTSGPQYNRSAMTNYPRKPVPDGLCLILASEKKLRTRRKLLQCIRHQRQAALNKAAQTLPPARQDQETSHTEAGSER